MSYNYMGFMNGYYEEDTKGAKDTKASSPSAGQIKYYNDLCKQRNIVPLPPSHFTFDTMSEEIKKLMAYYPASPAQLELIDRKIESLTLIVNNMKFTPEQVEAFRINKTNVVSIIISGIIDENLDMSPIITKLTGGKNGTANKLIESLLTVERQFSDMQPISEQQLEMIVSMFLCPDVDFEKYGISRRIDLEGGLWRKPSPQEFAENIKLVLSRGNASKFIDEFRGAFHEWKKTRIRPEQMRYIMDLEERLCNDRTLSEVHYAIGLGGEELELATKSKEYIGGSAYTKHTQEQLIQFSIEQATKFIDQLKAELERREGSSFIEPEIDYDELRGSKTVKEAVDNEYAELEDLMYRLEAVAGYRDEELHEAVKMDLVSNPSAESNVNARLKIRNFMKDLLNTKAITLYELLELTKSCPTAQMILIDM